MYYNHSGLKKIRDEIQLQQAFSGDHSSRTYKFNANSLSLTGLDIDYIHTKIQQKYRPANSLRKWMFCEISGR